MTTDEDDGGERGSEDEDLNLEALFDSLPSEEPDAEEDGEVSGTDENEARSDPFGFEDEPDAPEETPDGSSGRGRFDDFLQRVDGSQESETSGRASSKRQNMQELLGRVNGDSSDPPPEEGLDPESFMERESGSGGTDSETVVATGESSGSSQFDDPALEGLADASDVLFEASRRDGGSETDTCQPFFSMDPLTEQNVLLISLSHSAEDRRQAFLAGADGKPANMAMISSSDEDRQRQSGRHGGSPSSGTAVQVVDDPGDLTRLGITISNELSSWQDNHNQTLVCFDSVSILLQYAELQRVFRFIHVLQGRLGNIGARTHYHLNPEAHDSQTEATMQSLFDGVITVSASGDLSYE